MEKQVFEQLLQKFLDEMISQEELTLFLSAADSETNLAVVDDVLRTRLENKADTGFSNKAELKQMFLEVLKKVGEQTEVAAPVIAMPAKKYFSFRRIAAAAIFTGVLATALYYFAGRKTGGQTAVTKPAITISKDVLPGGNKALLTLADGSTIVLDSAKEGALSRQGNTQVIKLNNGQLAYKAKGQAGVVLYNTISTPKGGTYKIILPDDTKVWLNAASSLRFPTAFTGGERNVDITGEAYFEVASLVGGNGKKVPFIVHVNEGQGNGGMKVEVLGTHFNIMAYADEKAAKTTLLEGAVKVTQGSNSVLLSPMQQARASNSGNDLKVTDHVDTNQETAWVNGMFQYNDADFATIMRQLCRWYDVEVNYTGAVPADHFTGKMPRNLSLAKVLKILELSDVHFRIEGKKIIVTA